MYKILGTDRKEYGPATAEEVRQWILDGRVTAQTQVQAQGSSEWKPLSGFHEFDAAFAAKAAPPSLSSAAGAMPSPRAPSSGLAIASLVLGVMAFVGCSFLTGVPARSEEHTSELQ